MTRIERELVEYLTDALKLIRNARDHYAEFGEYENENGPSGDQCFDDWAADLADHALRLYEIRHLA